jgi:putative cell wall-binding protein
MLIVSPTTITGTGVQWLINNESVSNIIIVGGPNAVSTNVENEIHALHNSRYGYYPTITRVYGPTRVGTAEQVAALGNGSWSNTAVVVYGEEFADALAISAFANFKKTPLFLTDTSHNLTTSSLSALYSGGFSKILIVGGTSAVYSATQNTLNAYFTSANVIRLSGVTRYQTSIECAKYALNNGMNSQGMGFCTGENFPDGLTGGATQGKKGSVLLFATDTYLSVTQIWLTEYAGITTNVAWYGGTAALTNSVRQGCRNALNASISLLGWDLVNSNKQLLYNTAGTQYQSFVNSGASVWNDCKPNLVIGTSGSNAVQFEDYYSQDYYGAFTYPDGWIRINTYNMNPASNAVKLNVCIHELGHALGLDHNIQANDVLYPVSQGITSLSLNDRASLFAAYRTY